MDERIRKLLKPDTYIVVPHVLQYLLFSFHSGQFLDFPSFFLFQVFQKSGHSFRGIQQLEA